MSQDRNRMVERMIHPALLFPSHHVIILVRSSFWVNDFLGTSGQSVQIAKQHKVVRIRTERNQREPSSSSYKKRNMLSKLLRACIPCVYGSSVTVVHEEAGEEFGNRQNVDATFQQLTEVPKIGKQPSVSLQLTKRKSSCRCLFSFIFVLKVETIVRGLELHPDFALFGAVWKELLHKSEKKTKFIEPALHQAKSIQTYEAKGEVKPKGESSLSAEDEGWTTVLPKVRRVHGQKHSGLSQPSKSEPSYEELQDITDLCPIKTPGRKTNGKHCRGYKAVAKRRCQSERRIGRRTRRNLDV